MDLIKILRAGAFDDALCALCAPEDGRDRAGELTQKGFR